MAYATQADVEAAIGHTVTDDVSTLLESAADLILGYLNQQPPDPLPDAIVRVNAEMVAACLNRPQPSSSDDDYNASSFAYKVGPPSVGPWLTNSQKVRLDFYRLLVSGVGIGFQGETTGFRRSWW